MHKNAEEITKISRSQTWILQQDSPATNNRQKQVMG